MPYETVKPYGDKVLVKVIPEPEGTIQLLNKEKPQKGIVVDVGSKATEIPVGVTVSFARYTGTEITLGNELHLLLPKRDVLTYE